MNTMADGATQRLVAQIGEALFGQPGLTLMELEEKVKGMPLGTAHAAYHTGKAIGRREAELSAQPSPGGQDALTSLVVSWRAATLDGGSSARHYIAGIRACADELEAALAARQPAGVLVPPGNDPAGGYESANDYGDRSARQPDDYSKNLELRLQEMQAENGRLQGELDGYRQPLGQEPVGYRWRHSAGEKWQYSSVPCGWEYEPLYAAPPARTVDVQEAWIACGGNPGIKATREELMDALRAMAEAEDEASEAVDLGKFREVVAYAARSADFATHVEIGTKLRQLLALIDSQAVGNG